MGQIYKFKRTFSVLLISLVFLGNLLPVLNVSAEGQVQSEDTNQTVGSSLTTTEQQTPNVFGSVKAGTEPIDTTLSIRTTSSPEVWYNTSTDINGNYSLYLPDGEYQIDGIWSNEESKWYEHPTTFRVVNGQLEGQTELHINVSSKDNINVSGSVKNGTKPVQTTLSMRTTTGTETWFNTTTNTNGDFSLFLPDGSYQIDGIWSDTESKWYPHPTTFNVVNGAVDNPAALHFNVGKAEEKNVFGYVRKGSKAVETTLSIYTTSGSEQWYNVSTDTTGSFSLYLPDGAYAIDGIWSNTESKWYATPISFTVSDGQLEGQTDLPINIGNPSNITGYVKKGTVPVNTTISIHSTTGTVEWFNATTDSNGNFNLYLPDGEYQIDGIWSDSEGKWYDKATAFSVLNGQLVSQTELQIDLGEASNVLGFVKKGTEAVDTTLSIYTTVNGTVLWYNASTDANGNFEIYLPDGEYAIDGIWSNTEEKWYQLDSKFSVLSGRLVESATLEINLLGDKLPNVKGSLVKGTNPISNVWISAYSTSDTETKWYNAKTDANGAFEVALPDGSYQIDGVWVAAEEKWYPLQLQFSVLNGLLVGNSTLLIDLTKGLGSIPGVVVSGSTPVSGVWISAHTTGVEELWYNAKTTDTGAFKLELPDGEYQIEGIWVSTEQKWYPIVTTFSVEGGVLVGSTGLNINVQAPVVPDNVLGTLLKGTEPLSGVWVSTHSVGSEEKWYSAQTDTTGAFAYNLPDGDYRIEGVWVNSDQTWYPLGLSYSVVGGKIEGLEQLHINLQQEPETNVKGSLAYEGSPVGDAYLSIEDTVNEYYYDVNTDMAGNFAINLPDGNYKVDYGFALDQFNDETFYFNNYFTVVNGQLYENGIQSEALELTVSPVSLKIKLMKDGMAVNAKEILVVREDYSRGYFAYDKDGNSEYTLHLPDGSYFIDGYYDQEEIYHRITNQSFEIIGGTTNSSPILVELDSSKAINGTVTDSNGTVAFAGFYVDEINTGSYLWIDANETGSFSTELPDGDYIISKVYDDTTYQDVIVNKRFSVLNGEPYENGYPVDGLTVFLPGETMTVQLVKDGQPLVGEVEIDYVVDGYYDYYLTSTDQSGYFSVRAVDGVFNIYSIYSPGQYYYEIGKTVEVVNGTTNPSPYVIDLTRPQGNVMGTLRDSSGPLANVEFYISDGGWSWDYAETNANGEFAINLSDGVYVVNEAWVDGKFVYMNTPFEVLDGQLKVNGLPVDYLDITVPDINLAGVVSDENGVVPNASLVVEDNNGNYEGRYYVNADDNGYFSERFQDGSYTIVSTYANNNELPLNIPFEIVAGKIIVNGVEQSQLDVSIPTASVSGKLVDGNGLAIPNNYFSVSKYDLDGNFVDWFYAETDENGEFQLRYTEGEYFIPTISVDGYEQIIFVNAGFTVTPEGQLLVNGQPQTMLNLQVPSETFKGRLVENGNVLSDASIEVELIRSVSGNEVTYYQNIFTDSMGNFSARLADGEYRISEVNDDYYGYKNVNIPFQIIDGVSTVDFNTLDVGVVYGNVTGVVLDSDLPVADAELRISKPNGGPSDSYFIYTNSAGKFGMDLPDGQYQIGNIWSTPYSGPLTYQFTVENGQVKVNGIPTPELIVTIPQITVQGQMMDGDVPVANQYFNIVGRDDGRWYNGSTDENGSFSLRVPDGSYKLGSFRMGDTSVLVNTEFSVTNGQLYVNGEQVPSLNISLPPISLKGQLVDEGTPVSSTEVSIVRLVNGQQQEPLYAQTDSNGNFSFRVTDGDYVVRSAYINGIYKEIKRPVTVLNGTTNPSPFVIDISEPIPVFGNVQGTILDEDIPVTNTYLSIFSVNMPQTYQTSTNADGNFGLDLPDGNYQISYVSGPGFSFNLSQQFSIVNGSLVVEGEPTEKLIINLPSVTVTGQFLDGATPVSYASIYVKDKNNLNSTNASTDMNGNFSLRLADGDYIAYSAYAYGNEILLNVPFSVINGDLVMNGTGRDQLNLKMPAGLVTGTLYNENQPLPYVDLYYKVEDGSPSYQTLRASVDGYGNFSMKLPDGKYKVLNAYSQGETIPVNQLQFSVINGELYINGTKEASLIVHSIPVNVTGTLMDGDVPLSNTNINITNKNTHSWMGTTTDGNGGFTLRLPDGEYSVESIWSQTNSNIRMDIDFSIVNGNLFVDGVQKSTFDLIVPPVSLNGVVNDYGSPAASASINFESLTHEDRYYYSYANENGEFETRLPDGDYAINNIYFNDISFPVYIVFSIVNGQLQVKGVNQQQLLVELPTNTISGQLFDSGVAVADAWIVFTKYMNGEQTNWFGSQTDANGNFTLRLPDGEYSAIDTGFNEQYMFLNTPFEVRGGKLFVNGIEEASLMVNTPDVIYSGQLLDEGLPVPNASLGIYPIDVQREGGGPWQTTGENGNFEFRLPDGSYYITSVWTEEFEANLNTLIKIENGMLFVEGLQSSSLNLELPQVSLVGNVVKNGTPFEYGYMDIKDIKTGLNFGARISTNGLFELRLPDGEYLIENIYGEYGGGNYPVNQTVVVENGTTTPSPYMIDISEPGDGFVKGTVVDGTVPVANTSVNIMNVDDYSYYNATTNSDGNFNLKLPDGNYKVTYISGNNLSVNLQQSFSVENGNLTIDGVVAQKLTITLPSITVTGKLMDGENSISWAHIYVKDVNNGTNSSYAYTDENGNFTLRLPDGEYKAVSASNYGVDAALSVPFSVVNGELVFNSTTGGLLNLEIPEVTVTGTLFNKNVPYPNVNLHYNSDERFGYDSFQAKVDETGNFALRLPDGNYVMDYVYDWQETLSVEKIKFSVVNGQLMINGSPAETLAVNVIPENVTGTLVDGDTPLADTSISIINKETNHWEGTTSNEYGEFSLRLPDGEYNVDSIWSETIGNIRIDIDFSIINGNLFINGEQRSTLDLSVPQVSLTGIIKDYGSPAAQATINFESLNDDGYYYTTANELGEFEARLPDGDYVVNHVYYNDYGFPVYIAFSIVNGQLQIGGVNQQLLDVELPTNAVTGQLMDLGVPVANASLVFTGYVNGEQVNWFGTNTDGSGNFTIRVPDGQFRAIDADIDGRYMFVDQPFEVRGGKLYVNGIEETSLMVNTPEISFTGQLLDTGVPVPNAEIGIYPIDVEREGGGSWKTTDENGNFEFRLPEGNYYITSVWAGEFEAVLNTRVTIKGGQLFVGNTPSESLILELPQVSFVGNVVKDGTPYGYSYIEMKDVTTGLYTWGSILENGDFGLRLPDGEYVIERIYDMYGWDSYSLNQSIIIENGTTNPSPYVIDISGL